MYNVYISCNITKDKSYNLIIHKTHTTTAMN